MHTSGKFLLGLVIAGAAAAVVLSAEMLNVRGSWMEANQDLKDQNEQFRRDIAAKQKELDDLKLQLERTLQNWDRYWTNAPANFDPNSVQLAIGVGRSQGLVSGQDREPPGENPTLYLFRPEGDGSVFAGPFQPLQILENNAILSPAWPLRPGEGVPWRQAQQNWRAWKQVPPDAVTRFTQLQKQLVEADETLAVKQRYVALQQSLLQEAKKQNAQRYAELLGPENPPAMPDDLDRMEYTHGLLPAVAAEEEARNQLLAEVDRLRHDVKRTFDHLAELVDTNKAMVQELRTRVGQAATETALKEIDER